MSTASTITVSRARDGRFHAQCRRRAEDGTTHALSATGETASAARTALLQQASA